MKTGITNAKGKGGGSETSGCYLLENASTMTHLYAYTYEGLLRDIDNRNDFPLKNGDTLIGDDNYLYKLMTIDEDLGTFTAVQFWKLDSPTPTIEITFDQAISSDTYELDSDQFGLIQNNEVVKVDLYSESELLTFIKKSDDGSNIVMGTIITYDSTNSVYVYKEAVINVSSYEMTITDMTLSSGGGGGTGTILYQHNINLFKEITRWIENINLPPIITDSPTPITLSELNTYLYNNGWIITSTARTTQKYLGVVGTEYDKNNSNITTKYVGIGYYDASTIRTFTEAGYGDISISSVEWSANDEVVELGEASINGGGSQLYQHRIDFYNDNLICHLDIFNDSPTAFTKLTFKQYLSDNTGRFCANGYKGLGSTVQTVINFIRVRNSTINISGFGTAWSWGNNEDIDTEFFDATTIFADTIIAL